VADQVVRRLAEAGAIDSPRLAPALELNAHVRNVSTPWLDAHSLRQAVGRERDGGAAAPLTSEGRILKCVRKRLLKWDELLNPMEYAISVIDWCA
jgi:hypothetical protein